MKANPTTRLLNEVNIMKDLKLFDNGGLTADRYAAIFTGDYPGREDGLLYVTFSENPAHPQGVWMYGTTHDIDDWPKDEKEITLEDLPKKARICILEEYEDVMKGE